MTHKEGEQMNEQMVFLANWDLVQMEMYANMEWLMNLVPTCFTQIT